MVLGDFNGVLNGDERIRNAVKFQEMAPFRTCVERRELQDIKVAGNFFTWNNKHEGDKRVYSRIDRVMANEKWLEHFDNVEAFFMNEGEFDLCPGIVRVYSEFKNGKKPFRFFNMWCSAQDYSKRVEAAWGTKVEGTRMYRVVQKLKLSKSR